jgi:hypothetical protein
MLADRDRPYLGGSGRLRGRAPGTTESYSSVTTVVVDGIGVEPAG